VGTRLFDYLFTQIRKSHDNEREITMSKIPKTTSCICKKQGCWGDGNNHIPAYCYANNHINALDNANKKYSEETTIDYYKSASLVSSKYDGMRPRIAEAIDFVKEMGFHKIGFAACLAFEYEMKTIREIFVKEELEPIIVGCQIGNSTPGDRGVAELLKYSNSTCNPIGQAEILNEESTQLNFIVGLYMGHDILFSEYSSAPVSTLVVKDRMTGNNPVAALHGYHLRKSLLGIDRWEK
jgi:uncharacterized metal-binding protein